MTAALQERTVYQEHRKHTTKHAELQLRLRSGTSLAHTTESNQLAHTCEACASKAPKGCVLATWGRALAAGVLGAALDVGVSPSLSCRLESSSINSRMALPIMALCCVVCGVKNECSSFVQIQGVSTTGVSKQAVNALVSLRCLTDWKTKHKVA